MKTDRSNEPSTGSRPEPQRLQAKGSWRSRRIRGAVAGVALLALTAVAGCGSVDFSPSFLERPTPRELYLRSLEDASLTTTRLGAAWTAAGSEALTRAAPLELPVRETLHFDPREPTALAYRLALRRGQKVEVRLEGRETQGRIFVELFRLREAPEPPATIAVDETEDGALVAEVEEDADYALRLQPELLAGGTVTVLVAAEPTLTFPVAGKDARAVGSVFGDPRDGGSRSHRGIDIFAPLGTDAVAAAGGLVTRVGENRLGGNVVWMRSWDGLSFYYAHLDRQTVNVGSTVEAGEPVGKVGNTGNARTTPPHLHFGVFDGGAVDPYPFVAGSLREAPPVTAETGHLGQWSRIRSSRANVRSGPSTRAEKLLTLPRGAPVRLHSSVSSWHRVELPGGVRGFISASLVEPAERPLRSYRASTPTSILHTPGFGGAAVGTLDEGEAAAVLAEHEGRLLVSLDSGVQGWIQAPPQASDS